MTNWAKVEQFIKENMKKGDDPYYFILSNWLKIVEILHG